MGANWQSSIPFDSRRIGAAAIYCSDGRYNEQFDEFLHGQLRLPRYDRLVFPGGPGVLAGHMESMRDQESLEEQIRFLVRAHELERVVLIAHEGCGYYARKLSIPASRLRETQLADLSKSAERLRSIAPRVSPVAYIAGVEAGAVVMTPVTLGG